MKQIFIFGSNGFIGQNVVQKSKKLGYQTIGIDYKDADVNADILSYDLSNLLDLANDNDIGIINCAGYNQKVENAVDESNRNWFSTENWDKCIKLNLTLPFLISKLAENLIYKTKNKVDVIFLGSLYSIKAPNNSIYEGVQGIRFKEVEYVASKHGVVGLTKALNALNLSERLRFNCISPGAVYNSGMSDQFLKDFKKISGGNLNSVDEIAEITVALLFSYWTLYRGANIETYGGAFN